MCIRDSDHRPTYWTDFEINGGEPMESTVAGNAPDGESVAIVFDSGGKNGIPHRKRDILQINATGTVDLGALNLRLSAVIDNNTYESNGLPTYNIFADGTNGIPSRLAKGERSLTMTTARANYFLNPNMLVTAGISTFSRSFESYDDGMGKPSNFGDAVSWGDSASIAAAGIDASWWGAGNTLFATPGAT